MLTENFSLNLRAARVRRGLTQGSLAAMSGVSVSYVSMLERGSRSPPLETIEAIAEALALAPLALLQEAPRRGSRAVARDGRR
jgi:transcriptional regulator with XRE-family HTH domain